MFGDEITTLNIGQETEAFLRSELAKASTSERRALIEKFVLAALGSIPWIGGFLSAAATYEVEGSTRRSSALLTHWLEEHARKLGYLRETFETITSRFENLGTEIDERVQSEEYLNFVRRAFRVWDDASTEQKRRYVGNAVVNAASTRICSDDVIRLFLDWLNLYHESHFALIRQIYTNRGTTRYEIWDATYGEFPREDSAEADLFRMLIRDLSTGEVIRQEREPNQDGRFLRKRRSKARQPVTMTMESAFEDSRPYVLTGLGEQFVHYTMAEAVTRIRGTTATASG